MKFRKLTGMILGGIGAITGIAFLSGCGEELAEKPIQKLSETEVKSCCGDDDGSFAYLKCIDSLSARGTCEPPGTPGKPDQDQKIKNCCGDDDGSDAYKACVTSYKELGGCDNTVYGPPPQLPSDTDVEECCSDIADPKAHDECRDKFYKYCEKEISGGQTLEQCVAEYKKTNQCVPSTVYGMPDDGTDDEKPEN